MGMIRAFVGTGYSAGAGEMGGLVCAPSYSPQSEAPSEAQAASEYNFAHLVYPKANAEDRSKYVKYAQCAATLAEWLRGEILIRGTERTLYRYTQVYGDGRTEVFAIGLARLDEVERDGPEMAPHEKEDRLRLLEATRAHLEPIPATILDPKGSMCEWFNGISGEKVGFELTMEGLGHRLEAIAFDDSNPVMKNQLERSTMRLEGTLKVAGDTRLFDAAVAFRQARGKVEREIPEDFGLFVVRFAQEDQEFSKFLMPSGLVAWNLKDWVAEPKEATQS